MTQFISKSQEKCFLRGQILGKKLTEGQLNKNQVSKQLRKNQGIQCLDLIFYFGTLISKMDWVPMRSVVKIIV